MIPRQDGRLPDALRPLKITRGYMKNAEGSALIEMGETKVICTASVEQRVPPWLVGKGTGWVTAEYAMLPRATNQRTQRETRGTRGRTQEIQRLVGRSLRAVVALDKLGQRTIWIDCDVIQADGGTRTASISGAYVALVDAVAHLKKRSKIDENPILDSVAAVSVGMVGETPVLDLCYAEDSAAEVDMNIVKTGKGKYIEVQGTAEGEPFDRDQMTALLDLADLGLAHIGSEQARVLKEA
jgi:ribonuclease PH